MRVWHTPLRAPSHMQMGYVVYRRCTPLAAGCVRSNNGAALRAMNRTLVAQNAALKMLQPKKSALIAVSSRRRYLIYLCYKPDDLWCLNKYTTDVCLLSSILMGGKLCRRRWVHEKRNMHLFVVVICYYVNKSKPRLIFFQLWDRTRVTCACIISFHKLVSTLYIYK